MASRCGRRVLSAEVSRGASCSTANELNRPSGSTSNSVDRVLMPLVSTQSLAQLDSSRPEVALRASSRSASVVLP